jgi:hypothetical protein
MARQGRDGGLAVLGEQADKGVILEGRNSSQEVIERGAQGINVDAMVVRGIRS